MKFIYMSVLALGFTIFQAPAFAANEQMVVEQLDEKAIAEENANSQLLVSPEVSDEMSFLRDRNGHNGGRGWHRPGGFVRSCFARNGRGQVFRASGFVFFSQGLQQQAMIKCRNNSRNHRSCYAIGCRW